MTTSRNADALIDAFLTEGVTDLPDRVFDSVRGEIHRARQRIVVGPVAIPRGRVMTRLAIAAAVVVALSVTWLNLGIVIGPGGPIPAPSPTDSQGPAPTVRIVGAELEQALAPGRWAFDPLRANGSAGAGGPTLFVTIPSDGWTRFEGFAADKNYGPSDALAGPSFVVWNIQARYVNGCTDLKVVPTPGGTVDDILEALAGQPLVEAGPITDVTIDGYTGKYVEIRAPLDISDCPRGFYPFVGKYVQGPGEIERVYALDVDGFRLTFFARITQVTTMADLAELESIIASIDIEP